MGFQILFLKIKAKQMYKEPRNNFRQSKKWTDWKFFFTLCDAHMRTAFVNCMVGCCIYLLPW